jgi:aquaporin Z
MAEAFFRKYSGKKFNVSSAGTTPSSQLNPFVVKVMKEIGIDVTKQSPKLLSDSMIDDSFRTVNMGCVDKESCPALFVKDVLDWNIVDPKEKSIEQVRKIRDQIEFEVKNLVKSLEVKKIFSNLQIFIAELIGTFILVIFATGSIVYDAKIFDAQLGIPFTALAPFLALLIGVYAFGRVSLAHFNPAVTVGYYITGHITKIQAVYYFAAEIIGAFLGSIFVLQFIGDDANLGANAPNYDFSIFLIFPVEVLASAMLMGVIFYVVYTKGLRGFSGVAIGGIVGLDILFLAFISGASMNPFRALAPAILSGSMGNLWIYLSAPFIGTAITAFLFRGKFRAQRAANYE